MTVQEHANQLKVFVGGAPLAKEAAEAIVYVAADDNLQLPDMLEVTFRDSNREILKKSGIKIGTELTLKAFTPEIKAGELLITAEVTALEAEYDSAGTMTTVRALDKSNRLMRGRLTQSYEKMTYSDVAKKVAQRAGLKIGTVDSTTPVHDHVVQANVSDWHFLRGLASEVGFEMGYYEGKFVFRSPQKASTGPAPGKTATAPTPLQLVLGQNLLRFRAVVTAAEQVSEVEVRGWDQAKQQAVIGKAAAKTMSSQSSEDPAGLAGKFGGKKYVSVHTPFTKDPEVTNFAKALADQIAGASAEMEGTARGNPKLRAGAAVSLAEVDKPFDGKYILSSTRHTWTAEDGYTVRFRVGGRHERGLYSLVGSGNGAANPSEPNKRINGVVLGIVTDVKDMDKLGRVKVKFPWLDDKYQTDWARMVAAGAGGNRGMVVYPEVNDEVLVAFEFGDPRRPYVLGGLYSGKNKPMEGDGLIKGDGKIARRGFISRKGHKLVFLDDDSKSGVMMSTSDKKFRFSLNATKQKVRVYSDGKLEIEAKDDITIDGKKNIQIKAGMNIEMKAGTNAKLEAGANMDLKGSAMGKVEAGGVLTVKGSMVKIN